MPTLLNDNRIIGGHRIACGVHGAGEPVVLIHGTPSHSVIWREIVPRLVASGRSVHLFDLLGYGASERPLDADTSVAAQETLLVRLLDSWGLEEADIVGHDLGGSIGLRLAVHEPRRVRSLTVIDAPCYDSWPSPTWRKIIETYPNGGASIPQDEFEALLTRQLRMTVHDKARMSGNVLEAYLRPLRGDLGQTSFFRHQVAHYDSRYTQEITPELGRLAMPVRIVWGAQDDWQPLDWARRLSADTGAGLTAIPDAGHFVMEDAPDAVAAEIDGFLKTRQGEKA
ncbi:alpha/beta hydrolase [Kaustia mangrovi]|uniref:Alpha/beta hydrolase n=1 Tax=Kaustia mangrovi TaxID=2593653 RepID=A0A7S8C3F5_9HYPH|nr:alpha/beta hydrolase [Kaustia mangrovi]QPC42641.1 alpha/beta hydrolase [Kaustia mangrovi]